MFEKNKLKIVLNKFWKTTVLRSGGFFGILEKKDLSRHQLNLCNHKSENVPTGLNSKPSKRRTTYPIKGRV